MSRGLKLYTKIDSKSWPDEKSGRFKHCGADQGLKKKLGKNRQFCVNTLRELSEVEKLGSSIHYSNERARHH